MALKTYSDFYNQNRSFARSTIEKSNGSASALYLYDRSQSKPITILYQTGFADHAVNRFKSGAYKYEPALALLPSQNKRLTVNASVEEKKHKKGLKNNYWALFGDDGFHEILTSVEKLSKNLSLVIGVALFEKGMKTNYNLKSDKVLNTFDHWFDFASDFLVEDSVRRAYEGLCVPEHKSDISNLLEKLTSRETQILNLLTTGKINKQISALLSISQYTVDNHLRNIYRKLGVRRRIELISKLGDI